ncbi:MAG: outer membrane protein assembly factor BamB [Gammaproteobacteria bacterium]
MSRLFLFCLLSLSITGCAVTEKARGIFKRDSDNAEPPTPLLDFEPRINVIELWERDTGIGTSEQYLKLAPIITAQRLFIVDTEGSLQALDATNGRSQWKTRAKVGKTIDDEESWFRGAKMHVTGGPGYGENVLLIGTEEGEVIAFNANNGKEIWRTRVTSEILSAPTQFAGTAVVRTLDGKIIGLDGKTGRRLWIYDRTVPALTLRGTSTPVITEDTVIAGFDGGKLAALELSTGRLLWETDIATARGSSELERMVDIDSEPIIIEGIIYVSTFQGFIAAVKLDSGRLLWNRDVSSHSGLSVDENNVYVTDDDSHVWTLNRLSGTTVWKKVDLQARAASAPGNVGNYIVAGDFEGYLHWIDKRTGRFAARNRLCRQSIIAKPIIVGRIVYAYCSDGSLAAYTYR